MDYVAAGVALSQTGSIVPHAEGVHAGVIYFWLFKYTQQHIAGFIENSTGSYTSKAGHVWRYILFCANHTIVYYIYIAIIVFYIL